MCNWRWIGEHKEEIENGYRLLRWDYYFTKLIFCKLILFKSIQSNFSKNSKESGTIQRIESKVAECTEYFILRFLTCVSNPPETMTILLLCAGATLYVTSKLAGELGYVNHVKKHKHRKYNFNKNIYD